MAPLLSELQTQQHHFKRNGDMILPVIQNERSPTVATFHISQRGQLCHRTFFHQIYLIYMQNNTILNKDMSTTNNSLWLPEN